MKHLKLYEEYSKDQVIEVVKNSLIADYHEPDEYWFLIRARILSNIAHNLGYSDQEIVNIFSKLKDKWESLAITLLLMKIREMFPNFKKETLNKATSNLAEIINVESDSGPNIVVNFKGSGIKPSSDYLYRIYIDDDVIEIENEHDIKKLKRYMYQFVEDTIEWSPDDEITESYDGIDIYEKLLGFIIKYYSESWWRNHLKQTRKSLDEMALMKEEYAKDSIKLATKDFKIPLEEIYTFLRNVFLNDTEIFTPFDVNKYIKLFAVRYYLRKNPFYANIWTKANNIKTDKCVVLVGDDIYLTDGVIASSGFSLWDADKLEDFIGWVKKESIKYQEKSIEWSPDDEYEED